jgi:hypothetical protein
VAGETELAASARRRGRPLPSLANHELVAATLQQYSRGTCVNHAKLDVELHTERDGGQVPKQVRTARSALIGRDVRRRGIGSPAECQPVRPRAVAVDGGIRRPLELIVVFRCEVSYPSTGAFAVGARSLPRFAEV